MIERPKEGAMSRYIQQDFGKKKEPKKEKPRELTKPGKYTSADLEGAKKIITPNGGRR